MIEPGFHPDVNDALAVLVHAMKGTHDETEKLARFDLWAPPFRTLVDEGLLPNGDAAAILRAAVSHQLPGRPEDFYQAAVAKVLTPRPKIPLTAAEWAERELAEPDFISGRWLSTTSRAMIVAATGLGKTNFVVALGIAIAAGVAFLHWQPARVCRVLFIDGEMSARLLKRRVAEAARRLKRDHGFVPDTFFALSHEDLDGGLRPLNTEAGQQQIEWVIETLLDGRVDLIIFDNVMSLIEGTQKEEEGWAKVMPWILSLTRRHIGQIWVHHTGHNAGQSYGTKTREWQMDTVAHLEAVDRPDTDVSFRQEFRKARERTPETRDDFQDVTIAIINDEWVCDVGATERKKRLSPKATKFFEALTNVLASDAAVTRHGRRAAKVKGLAGGMLPARHHRSREAAQRAHPLQ